MLLDLKLLQSVTTGERCNIRRDNQPVDLADLRTYAGAARVCMSI